MSLEPDLEPPYELVGGEDAGAAWRIRLRKEILRFRDGSEVEVAKIVAPPACVMVPLYDDGTTVLVRQWRPAWWVSSWEAPAGTMEDGEDPLDCARRELAEEAGLLAGDWESLGTVRGTAVSTVIFHIYLARKLSATDARLEALEEDLVTRRLSLQDALSAARRGEIQHSPSIVALWRAAAYLEG